MVQINYGMWITATKLDTCMILCIAGLRLQVADLEAKLSACESFKVDALQRENYVKTEVCVI